ncbi:MAG: C39 family peptidase [Anaerolineales bacterium]|nr:C39 family peptidase [Anaerolineales bacterium]
MKIRKIITLALIAIIAVETALLVYQIPAVNERLAWRIDEVRARLRDCFFPHPDTIATADPSRVMMIQSTLTAVKIAEAQSTISPPSASPDAEEDLPTVTPTASRPAIPNAVRLPFEGHEFQGWNNCGPASLSMLLNFWGWDGNQTRIANAVKPNREDKNVMAYELERYIMENSAYGVFLRSAGTLEDVRQLIAAGFPVLLEKGLVVPGRSDLGWMGHYTLVVGYDDSRRAVLTQDSYHGPDYSVDYDALMYDWRTFNYLYLVVYPREREAELAGILGPDADLDHNRLAALDLARLEAGTLKDEAQAFAYFNLGTAHVARLEYVDAAYAYDMARYIGLPWRMLWYQTGPYFAYYYSGRHQDVVDLANATLYVQENLEESWYWRGMARYALGDRPGAIDDWREALVRHPGFAPALEQLTLLGEVA